MTVNVLIIIHGARPLNRDSWILNIFKMKVHFKDKLDVFTEAQIHCLKNMVHIYM